MKPFMVVKVGNEDRPASDEDVKRIESEFKKFLKDSGMEETPSFVTHHAVNIDIFHL